MDDGGIGTEVEARDIEALDEVLTRFKDKSMKLKISKCSFGKRISELLGHQITPEGLLPSEKHIDGMKTLRWPTNGTELLLFIGLVNYFSQFIPHFTDQMRPLHGVLEGSGFNEKKQYKSQKLQVVNWDGKWGTEQNEVRKDLKNQLVEPTFLAGWNPSAPNRAMTDVSDYGLGAVLLQEDDQGEWRPMAYAAKKMSRAETEIHNYRM